MPALGHLPYKSRFFGDVSKNFEFSRQYDSFSTSKSQINDFVFPSDITGSASNHGAKKQISHLQKFSTHIFNMDITAKPKKDLNV